ncbi:hypothetical protein Mapa_008733 [Marchantia paleacea]|nr:hypothetical protein Mapa_008733 [Marchantia paleacea]
MNPVAVAIVMCQRRIHVDYSQMSFGHCWLEFLLFSSYNCPSKYVYNLLRQWDIFTRNGTPHFQKKVGVTSSTFLTTVDSRQGAPCLSTATQHFSSKQASGFETPWTPPAFICCRELFNLEITGVPTRGKRFKEKI